MYNQIYSIVNDFIKAVEQDKNFSVLLKNWNGKRGPKRKLSITQVISLNLLRFTIHIISSDCKIDGIAYRYAEL